MTKHKRLNFSDRVKAEIYSRDKAICAFCGCDLWMFRHGASPYTGHDWADHIRPSSRGGNNLPDNGITACHACNIKKSDNTRDKEYFFQGGHHTHHYFGRFDLPNPLVTEAAEANQGIEWTDWYFNRAVAKVLIAAESIHRLKLGYVPWKRTPEYWVNAGLRFAKEWWRHDPSGTEGLRTRGLINPALEPDQAKLLEFFECDTVGEGMKVAHDLIPWVMGHRFFYILKCYAFTDLTLGNVAASVFGTATTEEAIETFFRHPYVAAHDLATDLKDWDILQLEGDRLVPKELAAWPLLPASKVVSLVGQLNTRSLKPEVNQTVHVAYTSPRSSGGRDD